MVLGDTCTQVELRVPNAAEGQEDVTFEGQWAPSQPGLDCMAIFDGRQWRLELLEGAATNVRSAAVSNLLWAGNCGLDPQTWLQSAKCFRRIEQLKCTRPAGTSRVQQSQAPQPLRRLLYSSMHLRGQDLTISLRYSRITTLQWIGRILKLGTLYWKLLSPVLVLGRDEQHGRRIPHRVCHTKHQPAAVCDSQLE